MSEQKKIDPRHVLPNSHGHCYRDWFVRLPSGVTAEDLKIPEIWGRVQSDRGKALARHDRVYAVGHDDHGNALFSVEARVIDATPSSAVLGFVKLIGGFGERVTPLFSDGTYAINWSAAGYAVIRLADKMQMGHAFGSEELAIRHLQSLYPRAVG